MDDRLTEYFLELPALRVNQPLGVFFVVSIAAKDLLAISFAEPMRYIDNSGTVQGSQRSKDDKRLKEIATYIDSAEMAFPNSIIIGANYSQNGTISKDENERWRIEKDEKCNTYKLVIPKKIELSAIIDGQHRLTAFKYVTKKERFDDLQLLCSVYFDLPNSYQAFLFATINSNQKKVDRSLALEQFGYNVDDESEKAWTPEKFAVFLSRKLNIDKDSSPLFQHIKIAPLDGDKLFPDGIAANWVISTATIVDGICSLITSNPKRDRIVMQQVKVFSGRSRNMLKDVKDVSPLRSLFLEGRDQTIYDILINYFNVFSKLFWENVLAKSYIVKTVGVQAAFDILKMILIKEKSTTPDLIDFQTFLVKASTVDFSDKFFQASGIGRSRIKNTIALASGLVQLEKIKKSDLSFYTSLIAGGSTEAQPGKWIWDEDAENEVINVLEKTNWNYDNRTVTISVDQDYENIETFSSYDTFFSKLVTIAETAFVSSLPSDSEFADQQREIFDEEELVRSCLTDYEANLTKLGWI